SARILASNTKLFTTAAALDQLGSQHRIETVLFGRGYIDGPMLQGDLVCLGGGDPTLGERYFGRADGPLERLARAVKSAGIRTVTGDLVLDDRLFDREHQHKGWPADQLDRWYAAPVGALALNDGCIDVTVGPASRAGLPAKVTMAPNTGVVEVTGTCTTTGTRSEHVVHVGRRPGKETYVVRGAVLAGTEPTVTSVAQWQPAVVFGNVLRDRLLEQGVEVKGRVRLVGDGEPRTQPGPGMRPVAVHGTWLAEILPVINKRSQNHWAEMTLKRLGASATGQGTFKSGAQAVMAWTTGIGIPTGEAVLVDGSGLARENKASPRALVRVLEVMAGHREADVFLASLAVGGSDGTLAKRLRGLPGAHRLRAKTGTIRAVSSLSGYVLPARQGDPLIAFSILGNNLRATGAARRAQDKIVEILLRHGSGE
ncbi:MAG: D-alanyl-D-alanine carboxypeptidase/D-alanyl-D-alanine endopeptidase, partial [Planctomycetota bacterium]